jgi:hypothetical protein
MPLIADLLRTGAVQAKQVLLAGQRACAGVHVRRKGF